MVDVAKLADNEAGRSLHRSRQETKQDGKRNGTDLKVKEHVKLKAIMPK